MDLVSKLMIGANICFMVGATFLFVGTLLSTISMIKGG